MGKGPYYIYMSVHIFNISHKLTSTFAWVLGSTFAWVLGTQQLGGLMVRPLVCPTGGLGSILFAECWPFVSVGMQGKLVVLHVESICVMTTTLFQYQFFHVDFNK